MTTATATPSAATASATVNGINAANAVDRIEAEYGDFHNGLETAVKDFMNAGNKFWLTIKKAVNIALINDDWRGCAEIAAALDSATEAGRPDLANAIRQGMNTMRAIAFGTFDTLKNGQRRGTIPSEYAKASLPQCCNAIGVDAWKRQRDQFKALYQIKCRVSHVAKSVEEKLNSHANAVAKILLGIEDSDVRTETMENFFSAVRQTVLDLSTQKDQIAALEAQIKALKAAK